jgi:hypothetical protein
MIQSIILLKVIQNTIMAEEMVMDMAMVTVMVMEEDIKLC